MECGWQKLIVTWVLGAQTMSDMLKRQDRENGRNRGWRNNFKRLQKELVQLEEDEIALDAVFPQVGTWDQSISTSSTCMAHIVSGGIGGGGWEMA